MYPVNIPLVSLSNHYVSLPLGSFVTTMDGKWMNSPYIPRLFRDGKLRIPEDLLYYLLVGGIPTPLKNMSERQLG